VVPADAVDAAAAGKKGGYQFHFAWVRKAAEVDIADLLSLMMEKSLFSFGISTISEGL